RRVIRKLDRIEQVRAVTAIGEDWLGPPALGQILSAVLGTLYRGRLFLVGSRNPADTYRIEIDEEPLSTIDVPIRSCGKVRTWLQPIGRAGQQIGLYRVEREVDAARVFDCGR